MLAQIVKLSPHLHTDVHADLHAGTWVIIVAAAGVGGTLVLAMATWKLAARMAAVATHTGSLATQTTALAQRTSEAVAAQFRPVIIPAPEESGVHAVVVLDTGTVNCVVMNVGPGPALDLEATLEPGRIAANSSADASVATDMRARLTFDGVANPEAGMDVTITYRDLSGSHYTTTLRVQAVGNHYRIVRAPITSDV